MTRRRSWSFTSLDVNRCHGQIPDFVLRMFVKVVNTPNLDLH